MKLTESIVPLSKSSIDFTSLKLTSLKTALDIFASVKSTLLISNWWNYEYLSSDFVKIVSVILEPTYVVWCLQIDLRSLSSEITSTSSMLSGSLFSPNVWT